MQTGTLPFPKERPEEWLRWATKTSRGRRGGYEQVPTIDNAMEFGIAVTKWWNKIQPEFRQTTDIHPLITVTPPTPTSGDVWAPLRKCGPNGLSIILVLLSWWGCVAKRQNRWDEDSIPAWESIVADVRRVLDAVAASTASSKRAGGPLSSKRKRQKVAHLASNIPAN